MSTPGIQLPWTLGGGIDDLVLFLQTRGFQVGPSEAIDAARLITHLARSTAQAPPHEGLDWLMPKLRPILCKRKEDQERFEQVFKGWAQLVRSPQRAPAPSPGNTAAGGLPPPSAAPGTRRKHQRAWALAIVLVLEILALRHWQETSSERAPPIPSTAPSTSDELPPAPAPPPITPKRVAIREARYGYYPAVRYNYEVRPWLASLLLSFAALSALGLAVPLSTPWLGHSRLSGRRIPLDLSSLRNEAKRIVPPLAPEVQARLERHIVGPPALRERLQRRPPLHIRRTIEATLRNVGVLSLHYRPARLRPSYLLVVEVDARHGKTPAELVSDPRGRVFYRWAERLRQQGIDVDIRLAYFDPVAQTALTCCPGGTGWKLDGQDGEPLDRLPNPPVGQRLVVISDGGFLVDEQGLWRPWAERARFHRWPQRAMFTPIEPRHWGLREDAIERARGQADAGFYVLPLDEPAFAAWAELIVTGRLPRFTLSRSQRYPKRLRALEDANLIETVLDPDKPVEKLDELLGQIKYYLGENGYYWLCACAVPPIVRWEITLLLGEQYYLNAQVPPDELARHIARDYPRLVLLPWLRRQSMPDWLRLALLDSLSPRLQQEVREVVRSRLGQIRPDAQGDDALSLEEPPGRLGGNHSAGATGDTLYLGFLAGHTPRQLMLRAPREWSSWLRQLSAQQRGGLWRDWLAALRDRLLWRKGLSFFGASRSAIAISLFCLAGLMAIGFALLGTDPATQPHGLRNALYREQAHGIVFPHRGPVRSAAFSPDGKWIITAGDDRNARIWDAHSGAPLGPLLKHRDELNFVDVSPDGRRVVTAGDDGSARIWGSQTGTPIGVPLQHADRVRQARFSPDGQSIATASSDGTARLWSATSGAPLSEPLRHTGPVNRVLFSPDGQYLLTTSLDHRAQLWDARTGAAIGPPLEHRLAILDAGFSPNGLYVATASADNSARVWEVGSGEPLGGPLEHKGEVNSAAFSPDGLSLLTASEDGSARIWDVRRGSLQRTLLEGRQRVRFARFSPDGKIALTATEDGSVQQWDTRSGQALGAPIRHDARINAMAFSPDGQRLVTASSDGTARLWDADPDASHSIALGHDRPTTIVAFSPEGRTVLMAENDGSAHLWNAESGAAIGEWMLHRRTITAASFSADNQRIVTTSADGYAYLWDAGNGAALGVLRRTGGGILHAAFSPDGKTLVTTNVDDTAQRWDAATGESLGAPLANDKQILSAGFSPDGRSIVSTSDDGALRVWDSESGSLRYPPLQHDGTVLGAAFSPDGRLLTTATVYTTRTWDAASGAPLGEPRIHEGQVKAVLYSADGRQVFTVVEGSVERSDPYSGRALGTPIKLPGEFYSIGIRSGGVPAAVAICCYSFFGDGSLDTVRVSDALTGIQLGRPFELPGPVRSVALSPDGQHLVAAWGSDVANTPATPPSKAGKAGKTNKAIEPALLQGGGREIERAQLGQAEPPPPRGGAQIWRLPPPQLDNPAAWAPTPDQMVRSAALASSLAAVWALVQHLWNRRRLQGLVREASA